MFKSKDFSRKQGSMGTLYVKWESQLALESRGLSQYKMSYQNRIFNYRIKVSQQFYLCNQNHTRWKTSETVRHKCWHFVSEPMTYFFIFYFRHNTNRIQVCLVMNLVFLKQMWRGTPLWSWKCRGRLQALSQNVHTFHNGNRARWFDRAMIMYSSR